MSCLIAELSLCTTWHVTRHAAHGECSMCCTWFAHNCARATWAHVLAPQWGDCRRSQITLLNTIFFFFSVFPHKWDIKQPTNKSILQGRDYNFLSSTGGGEVPTESSQVPWADLRLHNGLVPTLAQGCSDCCCWPLPGWIWHCVQCRGQEAGHSDHGHHPWWCRWELYRLLPEVNLCIWPIMKVYLTNNNRCLQLPEMDINLVC